MPTFNIGLQNKPSACWWFGGLVVWWFGGLVVWSFGGLVVWSFGGLVVWLFGGWGIGRLGVLVDFIYTFTQGVALG